MATERKLKQLYFNIEDPEEWQLWDWANRNIGNFSDWGKRRLKAEIEAANQHQERPAAGDNFSIKEITEFVQDLVKTEMAGHIIATDQEKGEINEEQNRVPDLSDYF